MFIKNKEKNKMHVVHKDLHGEDNVVCYRRVRRRQS